jgi:dTDP-4-dehydrorhamnose 3,5-epimerase-like enzyme
MIEETARPGADADPVISLPQPFLDDRGAVQPLVDMTMRSALMITSRKGTVRANHYHKSDWHYCYVVSGAIDYYWREVGSSEPPRKVHIGPGQLFFTPPLVEHAMVFAEDTVFLTLAGNPRDQDSYEDDLVRVALYQGAP